MTEPEITPERAASIMAIGDMAMEYERLSILEFLESCLANPDNWVGMTKSYKRGFAQAMQEIDRNAHRGRPTTPNI